MKLRIRIKSNNLVVAQSATFKSVRLMKTITLWRLLAVVTHHLLKMI